MLSSVELQSQIVEARGKPGAFVPDATALSETTSVPTEEEDVGEDGTKTLAKIAAAAAAAKAEANASVLQGTSVEELERRLATTQEVLGLFKEGVMLLDEVDLILHPLKSELNYPTGPKFDLDGSEDGVRCKFTGNPLLPVFIGTIPEKLHPF
jgi:hypothetical protein